jgi:electron transport complex protein RnfG
VLSHRETPGLGDKIDLKKSPWILSFDHKTLSNPVIQGWAVTKDGGDFDAFTGATVTPRAVVAAVKSAIEYSQNNRSTLFEMPEADES